MKKGITSILFFLLEYLKFSLHQIKEIYVPSGTGNLLHLFFSEITHLNTLTPGLSTKHFFGVIPAQDITRLAPLF